VYVDIGALLDEYPAVARVVQGGFLDRAADVSILFGGIRGLPCNAAC
jgi:hypothetical protein